MQLDSEIIRAVEGITSRYSRRLNVDWDDLKQEVFVKVLEYDGERPERLGGWIWQIARNEAVNLVRIRNHGSRGQVEVVYLDEDEHDSAIDGFEDRVLDRVVVDQLLDSLPTHEAEVVRLVYQGFNLREASEQLGLGYATTKKRFARAKQRLT